VARGIVTFALGTDTAGSGRVPAGLNNIVGLKPSLGSVSAHGVVPACRTLDTVSVFAGSVADADTAFRVMAAYDARDAFSRKLDIAAQPGALPPGLRVGVPTPRAAASQGIRTQGAPSMLRLPILKGCSMPRSWLRST
jgi:allophanate hydrolase